MIFSDEDEMRKGQAMFEFSPHLGLHRGLGGEISKIKNCYINQYYLYYTYAEPQLKRRYLVEKKEASVVTDFEH